MKKWIKVLSIVVAITGAVWIGMAILNNDINSNTQAIASSAIVGTVEQVVNNVPSQEIKVDDVVEVVENVVVETPAPAEPVKPVVEETEPAKKEEDIVVEYTPEGEVIVTDDPMITYANSEDEDTTEEIVEEAVVTETVDFEVVEVEPGDMYAIKDVNLRVGPDSKDFAKIGGLSKGDKVTVVGIVEQYKGETVLWYKLLTGEFVSGNYLDFEMPVETPAPEVVQNADGTTSIGGFTFGNSLGNDLANQLKNTESLEQAVAEGSGNYTDIKLH